MSTLFNQLLTLHVPDLVEVEGRLLSARIRQLARVASDETVSVGPFKQRTISGFEFEHQDLGKVLALSKRTTATLPVDKILIAKDFVDEADLVKKSAAGDTFWQKPQPKKPADISVASAVERCTDIKASWQGAFKFNEEVRDSNGVVVSPGLRAPQLGALHATLAHWSVGTQPATIVMPTGTGKTETMLALLTATGVERLLVVVPNAALRDQIAEKFETLGILKKASVLAPEAELPVVARLERRPTSPDEVQEIFLRANVIVTTMQVAGQCVPEVQEKMAELCSHLFIDEAHHIAARTWHEFKRRFDEKIVVQFTATPFRTDGKRVDGKFIYIYPLAKAQDEGYFRPINFKAVQGLDVAEADAEIIRSVGEQLAADLAADFDHLVMARARNIDRAIALHEMYDERLGEYSPVLIHSRMSKPLKDEALAKLRSRESRIIVCVDMLGEGFDLPQLKISGVHDRHKSVAITLQFTGRFTRDSEGIGNATVIANIEQSDVDDALRSLYAEDADWNFLLNVLSETKTGRQLKRAELMQGFSESLEGIPLQTLAPKMNTVIYKTDCDEWRPQEIESVFPLGVIQAGPIINDEHRLALFVTREEAPVRWSNSKEVTDIEWNLFMVHWDHETKLLYINSSKSKELHEKLAKTLCGDTSARIAGEAVYRALHGIHRLMLMNLGLSSLLGRHVRYTMFVGTDITAQISDSQFTAKRKSNLFGIGYDGTGKLTVGCSAKGKFWSMQSAADFSEWLEWCHVIGAKVTDETIATDEFIRNLVKQSQISERPQDKPVLTVHWPESFLIELEEKISLRFGSSDWVGFYDCEIEPENNDPDGPIRFLVSSSGNAATFEVGISETGATYTQVNGPTVYVKTPRERSLAEAFQDDPPHIYFADGDFLIFNELFSIPRDEERQSFNPERIETRDWKGVDLSKESQGIEKHTDSVQYSVIQELLAEDPAYTVIFDDDGTGEVSDIVALREDEGCLHVDLFHLKYSASAAPGSRVGDLYEVCGQAQKSVRWMEYPVRILKRLRKRDKDRISRGEPTRFEKGGQAEIREFIKNWKTMERQYRVWIVQPGLSKGYVEPKQLDLLAATENFLLDTYGAELRVVGSE